MQLDSTYNSYLQTKVLSSAETKELIKQHRNGDREALEEIVKGNQKLIISIVNKWIGNGIEYEDLIQEGNIGLLRAVEKFDLNMTNAFSTYAYNWVLQAIQRAIEEKSSLIALPNNKHQLKRKILRTKAELSVQLGRTATNEELAEELNIKPNLIFELVRATSDYKSLDEQNENKHNEEIGALNEIIEDPEWEIDFKEVESNAFKRQLDKILRPYDNRKQYIFKARYGIGQPPRSLESLAQEMGVSREWVRQMELYVTRGIKESPKAMKILKEWM